MYEGDTDLCMALVSTDNIHWEIAITYLVPLHEIVNWPGCLPESMGVVYELLPENNNVSVISCI